MLQETEESCQLVTFIKVCGEVVVLIDDVTVVTKDITKDHASKQEHHGAPKSFIVIPGMIITKTNRGQSRQEVIGKQNKFTDNILADHSILVKE